MRAEGRALGVSLEGLRTVPGWLVRFAAGAAVALLLLAAGFARIGGPVAWPLRAVAVAMVVAVVVRPWPGWGAAALLLAGLRMLGGPVPDAVTLAAVLLVGHAAAAGGVLAARMPMASRVELAVLAAVARRAWPVQVAAQALALVVRPVTGGGGGAGSWLWRTLALAVAAGLVAAALPASRRRR